MKDKEGEHMSFFMTRGYAMSRFTFSLMVAMVTPLFWMIACSNSVPGTMGAGGTGGTQNADMSPACQDSVEEPCMRYHIPLDGNPSTDVALRNKYIAAFGTACYMSEAGTFDCFYQKWQTACADAVKIGEVSGNAPFDKGYMCQPDGADNYTLQIGPDVANQIVINYQAAPRQTPLTDVNGMPTEVNGPYRNLTDPADVGPGSDFYGNSGMPDGDGGTLTQQKWILQVNRNANDGGIRSDLAGFTWDCEGADGGKTKCVEPDVLPDPLDPVATKPNVHHVVPMKDKRCCPWGTNSYKNAAVISRGLNEFLTNNDPSVEEVKQLNSAKPYPP
jgi:hypothetical protein